jgi:hypothetical protein
MQMLSALLCDFAADYSGKLSVLGAFDTIMAQKFPVTHNHCSLALRALCHDTDEGKHKFEIKLIDSDGRNILPKLELETQMRLGDEMFFASQNIVVHLNSLRFDKPGQYSIDVYFDNAIVSRVPLQVIKFTPPPTPAV